MPFSKTRQRIKNILNNLRNAALDSLAIPRDFAYDMKDIVKKGYNYFAKIAGIVDAADKRITGFGLYAGASIKETKDTLSDIGKKILDPFAVYYKRHKENSERKKIAVNVVSGLFYNNDPRVEKVSKQGGVYGMRVKFDNPGDMSTVVANLVNNGFSPTQTGGYESVIDGRRVVVNPIDDDGDGSVDHMDTFVY